MAGLVPAIHAFSYRKKVVDGRDEHSHDAISWSAAHSGHREAKIHPRA
jgi:hypothetical protein